MGMVDRIEQFTTSFVIAAGAAVLSGVVWLLRRILTNQREIEMLKHSLEQRDKLFEAHMARVMSSTQANGEELHELRTDVRLMRADISTLFRRYEGGTTK